MTAEGFDGGSIPRGLVCPGVFYPVQSGDGVLSRIRTPGGLLTSEQCAFVADVADQYAGGTVTVTNRANLQLRALADRLPYDVLTEMQRLGLACAEPAVDHLRNIMASPTAGLDPDAVVDTRPFVLALDRYITEHPHLARLPAKFSVGFDGGERASIAQQPNDALFRAYRDGAGAPRLRLVLRIGTGDGESVDLGFALRPEQVVLAAVAVAELYLSLLPADGSGPRLRHLLAPFDLVVLQQQLAERLPAPTASVPMNLPPAPDAARTPTLSDLALDPARAASDLHVPVGVHEQRAEGDGALTYVGLAPFVAGLSSSQLRTLGTLAATYGSGALRLSPWRNIVVPDVPAEAVDAVQSALGAAGLPSRAPTLASGIVTCAGSAGCGSGHADTVRDALALSARLGSLPAASEPLNIHLSGCQKRCAQRRMADVTLLARPGGGESYALYVRGPDDPRFGRLLADNLAREDVLIAVECLVVNRQAP